MKNIAHLKLDSPFYWIFPEGQVPIINIMLPNRAVCQDDNADAPQDVYMVNLAKLSDEQFDQVCQVCQRRYPEIPLAQVKDEIKERGLPIRASQVLSVSTDVPFHL
jgi:hypothetical protein